MILENQIQHIKQDLLQKGINMPGLETDILDHVLSSIEENMANGHSFDEAYQLASLELHGDAQMSSIQQHTINAINEGKGLWKNLLIYSITLTVLIFFFNLLSGVGNPSMILVCISLSIFFLYHSIFQSRKQYSPKANVGLFTVITCLGVMGLLVFLFIEFKGWGLLRMLLWSTLIMGAAIPLYLKAVKKVLIMDSTLTTFFSYCLELIALMSLLWIPLALALKVYRSDVAVLFFVDDLLVIAIIAIILSIGLKNLIYIKAFLKNNL